MTFAIGLLLFLVVVALVFLSFDWVPADVVSMGLLIALTATGLVSAKDAFAGFGSDTFIMIFGLLIMTAALVKTGMVDIAGRAIMRHAGTSPERLLLIVMLAVAVLSAFISNTAAAAFFLPVVIGVASKAHISPSRLLMPLAFASILSSSVTLVSTSTNLVVSGLMTTAGMAPMGMFELAPVGIPIALAGLIYMYFIGRRFLPDRPHGEDLIGDFGVRSYLTEVLVLPTSPLVGKTLADSKLGSQLDLSVIRVIRAESPEQYLLPRANMILAANDVLIVEGAREDVLKIKDTAGVEIRPEIQLSDPFLRSEDAVVAEALVVPGSPLVGRTLRRTRFREHHGLQVLGVHRHEKNLLEKLSRITLRAGDLLLIQGAKARLAAVDEERVLSVLGTIDEARPDRPRAVRTALIFIGVLALATFGVVPLALAGFIGAFLIFATRCISPADAYRAVDWRVLILIACMLTLGTAMTTTGAAEYLAGMVAAVTSHLSPLFLLGGFFVLTVLLTQPMSNQAAAAVIVPIAVATAQQLHLNPRTFVMMIAVAASCSYLTPLEPACLMVYGPGRYRFSDFFRVGLPLTVLLFIVAILLVPRVWPLAAAEF